MELPVRPVAPTMRMLVVLLDDMVQMNSLSLSKDRRGSYTTQASRNTAEMVLRSLVRLLQDEELVRLSGR